MSIESLKNQLRENRVQHKGETEGLIFIGLICSVVVGLAIAVIANNNGIGDIIYAGIFIVGAAILMFFKWAETESRQDDLDRELFVLAEKLREKEKESEDID